VSDTTGEPIVPQPQKARAAMRRKQQRRGTPRPNLAAINAPRREEAAARRGLLTANSDRTSRVSKRGRSSSRRRSDGPLASDWTAEPNLEGFSTLKASEVMEIMEEIVETNLLEVMG
jgi:hypothetical protein